MAFFLTSLSFGRIALSLPVIDPVHSTQSSLTTHTLIVSRRFFAQNSQSSQVEPKHFPVGPAPSVPIDENDSCYSYFQDNVKYLKAERANPSSIRFLITPRRASSEYSDLLLDVLCQVRDSNLLLHQSVEQLSSQLESIKIQSKPLHNN